MHTLPRWERSYSVGNWVLDNQHREILTLCQLAIDKAASGVQFLAVREELIACTDEHFSTEEDILKRTGYVAFDSHREEHRRCRSVLHRMLENTAAGKVSPGDFGDFISAWCMGHILESDRKFAASIQRVR